jgi:biopolymer transport protein ExbD
MKFVTRKRRQAPSIIIISLIDVLIVMVVFLLVTTAFKNQPSVALKLPETSEQPKPGASKEKPPMVVTIAKNDPRFYLGTLPVTPDRLLEELRTAAANDPQTHLVLRADEEASWRDVVRVMDFAKQTHLQNIRAFTRGPGSPR